MVNQYGPTETTMTATCHPVGDSDPTTGPAPLGAPISGIRVYVVDADGLPVPPGVTRGDLAGRRPVGVRLSRAAGPDRPAVRARSVVGPTRCAAVPHR
ncbi:AMP-binding protein [Micromonospora sp. R77]|uniref:AMP-binding protein n=1 Tax=Micromonospora sp. R77 TaxID=2925836 RepID=UPI0035AEA5F3